MGKSFGTEAGQTPADKNTDRRPLVVAIIGPTAAGKTDLAVGLAGRFDMEVVSADSRQVYRRLDIATAKPTSEQQAAVRHRLIDIIAWQGDYNIALYQRDAMSCIAAIQLAGKLPVIVGGSPLYLRALLDGYQIPPAAPQPALRAELERRAATEGNEALYQELKAADPAAAARIHPHNVRRVIRALEVYQTTGRPFSELTAVSPPDFAALIIGLHFEREQLYDRIDQRIDRQIAAGLVDETGRLLAEGVDFNRPALSSLGYREIAAYLHRDCSLEEAVQRTKYETHRYARHQLTWFRRWKREIHWLAGDDPGLLQKTSALIKSALIGNQAVQ